MKLLSCVIAPHLVQAVQDELAAIEVFRLTVTDVQTSVQTSTDNAMIASGVRLDIAVNESFVEPTLSAIVRAHAGTQDNSQVLVFPLVDVVRLRTGERGPEAI